MDDKHRIKSNEIMMKLRIFLIFLLLNFYIHQMQNDVELKINFILEI